MIKLCYERGIKYKSCECVESLGELLMKEGSYEKCIQIYVEAKLNSFENGNYLLAKLYARLKDNKNMLKYLKDGVEEGDYYCMYEMALYEESIGNIDLMLGYLEESCTHYKMSATKLLFYYCFQKKEKISSRYFKILRSIHKQSSEDILKMFLSNMYTK